MFSRKKSFLGERCCQRFLTQTIPSPVSLAFQNSQVEYHRLAYSPAVVNPQPPQASVPRPALTYGHLLCTFCMVRTQEENKQQNPPCPTFKTAIIRLNILRLYSILHNPARLSCNLGLQCITKLVIGKGKSLGPFMVATDSRGASFMLSTHFISETN